MVESSNTWNISGGMDVVGSDEEKVGDVADLEGEYVVVRKGFFFPTNYYIPISAISAVSDRVHLEVTRDEALNQGWDVLPAELTSDDERHTIDAGLHLENPIPDTDEADHDSSLMLDDAEAFRAGLAADDATAESGVVERRAIHRDEDVAQPSPVGEGIVPADAADRLIRVVDREVPPGDTVFEEDTIEITLRAEEVEIEKRVRIHEEVEIGKESVNRMERVDDTVRREEVRISGDPDHFVEDVDRHRR
jgi:hypothetical protein